MSTYVAPVKDMLFAMNELAGLQEIVGLPGNEEVSSDLVEAILDEAGKFASEVVDPLNKVGDKQGNKWNNGVVTTADGFKEAYATFCETGWNGMPASTEFGGQGLPVTVSTAVLEMWKSASISFSLCQMLTLGAVEAIAHHGSDELKATFLPNMVSGKWTGTMNLTEPQAGSDLAAIRSKAEPRGDGSYAITGTKIFITWGEHDMAENIIHLVLARLPDAPPGVKGISLFIAPKFLVNADGSLGERNDLICASIEHKMGIHGSATAVMSFGDKGGAIGYLVGEPNRGLEYMFTMMNHARLNVGLEGVGVSERSYQHALAYARERVQGRIIGDKSGEKKPILHHPDVRRMLMDMKSRTEAGRALAYYVAGCMDRAHSHPDADVRAANQRRLELLTPVVKGWCTENAQGITWNGVQVHGGMGFIEETGAAQYMRDARIITIYEGTTAIQANDLIGRKTAKEGGKSMQQLLADIAETASALRASDNAQLKGIADALGDGIAALDEATNWLIANYDANPQAAAAGSVPFLKLTGIVVGGWLMARSAAIAAERLDAADGDFYKAKIGTATYFAQHVIPEANSYRDAIVGGAQSVLALEEALF
ncbi:acyl-CoA dehydrogenase C-terminal domain-containing protein [Zoogloea sp.]|uniref:acyl-CoA dehydrogenase C-terminal domain-containing protein n=1 Tax=Zoogloea sp. TaxID=49181 RepID=UPI002638FBBA|nr:acyl-CoA dehydrogenase C-terminal domain-containing protein [uncultured Zoogloea sp.]MCK6389364.1 acyl-CoA dehydrogenase C-terminal domain-containing protein [Zoogloea sp.]